MLSLPLNYTAVRDLIQYHILAPRGVKLYQDQFSNEPDGKKDTLNCGNAVNSVANISHEDGDVAVNCETVNSQPNP